MIHFFFLFFLLSFGFFFLSFCCRFLFVVVMRFFLRFCFRVFTSTSSTSTFFDHVVTSATVLRFSSFCHSFLFSSALPCLV
ncbi:hypothetical protein EX30DRAFT_172807 [Ascodesmis nigricans]|uniref:Uncharacterized protein n=1 Tax=Ascodesmis nigricans TaxID=341454 RepID=A0A4V3SHY0_9PEZI|nr:hypothetical protein EX30DRAFT_172807 [Ascodesmis nigricans]